MTHMNTAENSVSEGLRNPLNMLILTVSGRFGSKAKEVERFLKFAVVGGFGALVDFGTLFLVQAYLLPPINTFSVAAATTIAFCAAILNNFAWNRFWTYPDSRTRSVRRQLAQFAFISFVGWLGRTIWISAAYQTIGSVFMPVFLPLIQVIRPGYSPSETAEAKLGTIVAMMFGIVVVMFWNFFANRYWTYNDVD